MSKTGIDVSSPHRELCRELRATHKSHSEFGEDDSTDGHANESPLHQVDLNQWGGSSTSPEKCSRLNLKRKASSDPGVSQARRKSSKSFVAASLPARIHQTHGQVTASQIQTRIALWLKDPKPDQEQHSHFEEQSSDVETSTSEYIDESLSLDDEDSCISLSSPFEDVRHENGRTYHNWNNAHYYVPIDKKAQAHGDGVHHLFCLTHGLLLVPVVEGVARNHVLDVGTGTGIWAIQYADEHSDAFVVGVDISSIQPKWIPSNTSFQLDNLDQEWTFKACSYNLIFCRGLFQTLALRDGGQLYVQAMRTLSPGGFLQVTHVELAPKWGCKLPPCIERYVDLMTEAMGKAGYSTKNVQELMQRAGFINVVKITHEWPLNRLHKAWKGNSRSEEIARFSEVMLASTSSLMTLHAALLYRMLDLSYREIICFLAQVSNEMKNPENQATWQIQTSYGQKPMSYRQEE